MRLEPEEQRKKATDVFLIVSTAVTTGAIRVLQDWDFERRAYHGTYYYSRRTHENSGNGG